MLTVDELDRLHLQLRESQERRQELEKQRNLAMADLRTAQSVAQESDRLASQYENERDTARREVGEARRLSERIPKLEEALNVEIEKNRNLRTTFQATQDELAAANARAKELSDELGNNNSELGEIRKKLKRAEGLAAAATELGAALKVIQGG